VAPAGGTAAAVVGAVGASLCEMVCTHTVNRDESVAAAADPIDHRDTLRRQRDHLLDLAETDAAVIDGLFPSSGSEAGQSGLKRSTGVPLTIARACLNVLEVARDVTETGTRNTLVDAGVGVFLVHSALRASVFTARHNLDRVPDPAFVGKIERRTAEIEQQADRARDQAVANVHRRG
jgi:formiminotetrahydrofolate cyclodeaminase